MTSPREARWLGHYAAAGMTLGAEGARLLSAFASDPHAGQLTEQLKGHQLYSSLRQRSRRAAKPVAIADTMGHRDGTPREQPRSGLPPPREQPRSGLPGLGTLRPRPRTLSVLPGRRRRLRAIADNAAGSTRAAGLGELARGLNAPWDGTVEATSLPGAGTTFELRRATVELG